MATSNNDRVSSARLLDMLKGLQESRHLGSEPEVVTETVEYPAVVYPAAGTYETNDDLLNAMNEPDDTRLPFRVFTDRSFDSEEGNFPLTIPSPSNNYVELTQKISVGSNTSAYVQDDFPGIADIENYTGYILVQDGAQTSVWYTVHVVNGDIDDNLYYVWEMPAYTEIITTSTKRPIKQDYLPNADWNQNDPDGDGYVENRTHWEEISEVSSIINVQSGVITGNFAVGNCDKFGRIKSFSYPNGHFDAKQSSDMFESEGIQYYYAGEDANGNAISVSNAQDLETALQTTTIGLLLMSTGAGTGCYIAYPNIAAGDVCSGVLVDEVIHKLPRRFYDYTEPYDDTILDSLYKKVADVDISYQADFVRSDASLTKGRNLLIEFDSGNFGNFENGTIYGDTKCNPYIDPLGFILLTPYNDQIDRYAYNQAFAYALTHSNIMVKASTDENFRGARAKFDENKRKILITLDNNDNPSMEIRLQTELMPSLYPYNGLNTTIKNTKIRVSFLQAYKYLSWYSNPSNSLLLKTLTPQQSQSFGMQDTRVWVSDVLYSSRGSFIGIDWCEVKYRIGRATQQTTPVENQWYVAQTIPVRYPINTGSSSTNINYWTWEENVNGTVFTFALIDNKTSPFDYAISVCVKYAGDWENVTLSTNIDEIKKYQTPYQHDTISKTSVLAQLMGLNT